MGEKHLPSEGLRRSPPLADAWKALIEVPSAALAVVLMALEVKSRRPNAKARVPQDPHEGVLDPQLRPLAPRTAHRAGIPRPDVDPLRPLNTEDFKLRQSDYTGIRLGHGILHNKLTLQSLVTDACPRL